MNGLYFPQRMPVCCQAARDTPCGVGRGGSHRSLKARSKAEHLQAGEDRGGLKFGRGKRVVENERIKDTSGKE
jgi:hypothetical protein